MVAFVMNDNEIEMTIKCEYVMIGSDCGFVNGCGHPRGAGAFPRIIKQYVNEKKSISIIDALRKMTILPADRLKLATKGEVKEGFDADLVVLNPDTIKDNSTYLAPTTKPSGIDYVIIGGKIAAEHGNIVNNHLGTYIPYDNLRVLG